MAIMLNYLAYGSNLHPLRLSERVPSARVLCTIPMPGRRLSFSKRSVDGSGKCTIESSSDHEMFGVLYEFPSEEKRGLDHVEGVGAGYHAEQVRFEVAGQMRLAYAYVADATHVDPSLKPYDWYKDLVLAGARYHGFPAHYVAMLEKVASVADPNRSRAAERFALAQGLARSR